VSLGVEGLGTTDIEALDVLFASMPPEGKTKPVERQIARQSSLQKFDLIAALLATHGGPGFSWDYAQPEDVRREIVHGMSWSATVR
jgi:hypothetical protein